MSRFIRKLFHREKHEQVDELAKASRENKETSDRANRALDELLESVTREKAGRDGD